MSTTQKLRIAIAGGGIGGLVFAVVLSKLNLDEHIEIDVYESAAELTQLGAGIALWPRGWEILKTLGLEKDLVNKLPPGTWPHKEGEIAFAFRKSDMKEGVPILDMKPEGGNFLYHRADVQQVLLKRISSTTRFHLSSRLVSYKRLNSHVELAFKDGKTATCDLLVGADGINSAVRKTLLTEGLPEGLKEDEKRKIYEAPWTGETVYRCLIDSEVIRKIAPDHPGLKGRVMYCGKNKHLVVYPVSQGKLLNTVPFVADLSKYGTLLDGSNVTENTTDDIASLYEGWEEGAKCLAQNMNKPTKWLIQAVTPLDRYVGDRVALLGDAAHGMPPHLGNGAGQAIEDALILGNAIAKSVQSGTADIPKILETYNAIRQPFGNFVARETKRAGLLYDFTDEAGFEGLKEGDKVSLERLAELGTEINEKWAWTWTASALDDLKKVEAAFQ